MVDSDGDFDVFYTTTSRRLVGQIFAMVGNLSEAEDAVQEAFCRAWPRWRSLRDYHDPEGWVRTVAYRIAVSSWRKAVNRMRAHRRTGSPQEIPGQEPERLMLMAALKRLPPDQRRVIVLHHLVGLSIDEIASEVGIAPGTVKSRLSRGRKALLLETAQDFA
jgi:RNA polymerase sigma-70 factor, ECF subfamily